MMNRSAETKSKAGVYVTMGLMACALAYIITREVTLPPYVLIFGVLVGGIILLLKGMSRPEIVTYVLVAYLPFSQQLAGDFGGMAAAFNLTNMLMAFIIWVWMTGQHSKEEPGWMPSPLNVPLYLFMFLGFIATIRTIEGTDIHYVMRMLADYKRWITPIFLYFLVLNTVKDRATIKNIVITIVMVTTIAGLMAIYDYINLGDVSSLDKSRIGGIVNQPNMLAAFFNYYMFIPFGFFLLNMKRSRYWLLLIPFLICFRGIMVTFSRGGYLAFALALYAITFFRNKFLFFLLLVASLVAVLNPVLLPAGIRYRMGQTFHPQTPATYVDNVEDNLETSSKTRVEIWKASLEMIKDHPFFGIGYGGFPWKLAQYWEATRANRDAHNTYIIIAAEMGIPALLVFLWIIWVVFINTWMLYRTTADPFARSLALGMLGGIFGLLMSNMFGSRLDSTEISSYFWILAAMIARLRILDEKAKSLGIQTQEAAGSSTERRMMDRRYKLDACWFDEGN